MPDPLIFELLEQCLHAPGASRLLFDGFPRTMGQVPLLEQFERKLGFAIDCYLDIVLPRAEAIVRMTGRRVCPVFPTPGGLMSTTTPQFDLDRFTGAAEARDAATQLSMYGPHATVTIADKITQPGSPRASPASAWPP